jgi:hypothetical protein
MGAAGFQAQINGNGTLSRTRFPRGNGPAMQVRTRPELLAEVLIGD